jgi:two-component system, chemotaxis family, sensor kinase Cph1
MDAGPAFGQADLTNCERELIHLAGSVQPHGALLVLREPDLTVVQASRNLPALLGLDLGAVLQRPLQALGGNAAEVVSQRARHAELHEPVALQCSLGSGRQPFEGALHRLAGGGLVLEMEPGARPRVARPRRSPCCPR